MSLPAYLTPRALTALENSSFPLGCNRRLPRLSPQLQQQQSHRYATRPGVSVKKYPPLSISTHTRNNRLDAARARKRRCVRVRSGTCRICTNNHTRAARALRNARRQVFASHKSILNDPLKACAAHILSARTPLRVCLLASRLGAHTFVYFMRARAPAVCSSGEGS